MTALPPTCLNLSCKSDSLCTAHIIPAALGKDIIKSNGKKLALVAPDRKGWFQSGIFDSSILCSTCDGALGLYDKHAVELTRLLNTSKETINRKDGLFSIQSDREIGHKHLAMFGIAVAWRASVSTKLDFSLGANESWFHDILFKNNSDIPPVSIARLVGKTSLTDKAAMDAIG